jgi:transcriptional regulator with XRE-family HTH domain
MQEINLLSKTTVTKLQNKRTARVVMCDEARVLKKMRKECGLSMRALGMNLGKSDSYISQIENGRMDIPKEMALEQYLVALGGINLKAFQERVRRFRQERAPTDRDELLEIARRANESQVKQILLLARTLIATQISID